MDRRKWLAAFLALVMMLGMAGTVSASENRDADDCIQQLMNYYYHHGDAAATDIACLLYELEQIDPEKAQVWASIMDYWHYANTDMTLYQGVLPDGLPQDNSLCIVVMGYALSSDGSMRSELIGRLEAALASAEKYPNAYVVCTGGGTAKNDKTVTEAGQMAGWLIRKGIDQRRVIIEDQAMSTVGNAINTFKILESDLPHVTHLALVTSDYHLARSCLLFYAQTLFTCDNAVPTLCVAANAAYKTGRSGPESLESQASDLSQLSKIPINGMPKPKLSKLERITVLGNEPSIAGSELELQVIAHYNTGLYRDVTSRAKYAGIDLAAAGAQNVTVTYEEGGIAVSSTVQIELLVPETEAPTQPPTEAPTELPTEAPVEPETESPTVAAATEPTPVEEPDRLWIYPAAILVLLLIAEFFIIKRLIKIRKLRKAAKAAAQEEADLPDDNSPLEYI